MRNGRPTLARVAQAELRRVSQSPTRATCQYTHYTCFPLFGPRARKGTTERLRLGAARPLPSSPVSAISDSHSTAHAVRTVRVSGALHAAAGEAGGDDGGKAQVLAGGADALARRRRFALRHSHAQQLVAGAQPARVRLPLVRGSGGGRLGGSPAEWAPRQRRHERRSGALRRYGASSAPRLQRGAQLPGSATGEARGPRGSRAVAHPAREASLRTRCMARSSKTHRRALQSAVARASVNLSVPVIP